MADSKNKAGRIRKVETMREKTEKASKDTQKPRSIRNTASRVTRPISKLKSGVKQEYHLFPQKESGLWGFLTKSRRLTPAYFRASFKELRLVTWPNRKETWRLMVAVFIFAAAFGLAVTAVDFVLDKLFKAAFL